MFEKYFLLRNIFVTSKIAGFQYVPILMKEILEAGRTSKIHKNFEEYLLIIITNIIPRSKLNSIKNSC